MWPGHRYGAVERGERRLNAHNSMFLRGMRVLANPGFVPCSCRAHLDYYQYYENGDGIAIRTFGDHGPDRVRT